MKLPILFLFLGILAATAAPSAPAPEATVNDFFHYLLSKRDIMKDAAAQTKYLTKDLRAALLAADAKADKVAKARPNEQVDAPSNGTFLAAWDPPTTFKVTETKATPPTARVEVLFTWGPKSQYAGETRKMTVHLAQEGGAWHVSDIDSHKSKFNEESTVLRDLRTLNK